MLIQRLVEHAAQDPDSRPFHRTRQFHWELRLNDDGQPLSETLETLLLPDANGKPRGTEHRVPAVARTVGVAPNLAADDAQYVLGWSDPDTKPERVARCHTAFVDLVQRWAISPLGRTDSTAQAMARFYRTGAAAKLQRPPDATAKQGVLVTVNGIPAYQSASVQSFWSAEVARRKTGGVTGLCLSCGTSGPLLDTVPGKVPARLVPGASNDAALVSVNERVFGYDLTTQLTCSPLCIACGEAMTAGLTRVLSSASSVAYNGQDSRLAWWTTQPTTVDPLKLIFEPDPGQIRALLHHSVRPTRTSRSADSSRFCVLTIGGNVARVVVRDWLEIPLDQVERNVAAWFADHEITPLHRNDAAHQSVETLVRVTGRWLRSEKRYAPIGAHSAHRPDNVMRDLLGSVIWNNSLPPSLLAHLVQQVRTDGRLDTARAALIRLALVRSSIVTETPMPGLDTQNTDPAYVAGRVFAALEALQHDAYAGRSRTTYSDRYLSGAITNPRAALVNGRKEASTWLRKLRRTKPGAAVNHEKTLDALFGLLNTSIGIPRHQTLTQQSTFLLGYHHQRTHRFGILRHQPDPATTMTASADLEETTA